MILKFILYYVIYYKIVVDVINFIVLDKIEDIVF